MCGFCNVWVCVCVGVLVICVFIFSVFLYCLYSVFLLFRLYVFILICHYCKDYCHRVKIQLQYIIIIIII